MKRIFLAAELDGGLAETLELEVARFRDALGEECRMVRWVPRERYHITLAFIGETREEEIPLFARILGDLEEIPEIPLTLGPPLVFPRPSKPRVLLRTIDEGRQALSELAASLRERLEAERFDYDRKRFRPHITVGYLRRQARTSGTGSGPAPGSGSGPKSGPGPGPASRISRQWMARESSEEAGGDLRAVTLFSSEPGERGPVYLALARRSPQGSSGESGRR